MAKVVASLLLFVSSVAFAQGYGRVEGRVDIYCVYMHKCVTYCLTCAPSCIQTCYIAGSAGLVQIVYSMNGMYTCKMTWKSFQLPASQENSLYRTTVIT